MVVKYFMSAIDPKTGEVSHHPHCPAEDKEKVTEILVKAGYEPFEDIGDEYWDR